jgi:RecG-like helicase
MIGAARPRQRVRVTGHVRSLRVQPRAGVPTLECVLFDDTGGLSVVFLGRRSVAGVDIGTRMMVEGVVGEFHGRLAILNPVYQLLEP